MGVMESFIESYASFCTFLESFAFFLESFGEFLESFLGRVIVLRPPSKFPHLVCYPLVVLEASATHWSIVLVPQSHWLVKAHYRHALQLLCHMMLDRDLAKAYGVETKALNQAVKCNGATVQRCNIWKTDDLNEMEIVSLYLYLYYYI